MNKWITIQTFTFPTEAYTAKAKLESCGINVFLKNENTTQVINIYSNAIGGVELQVESGLAEEARNILMEGGYIATEESKKKPAIKIERLEKSQYPDKTKCPFCSSENIDTIVRPNIFVVLFYFLLGVIFPLFKSWEKCYDCEKEWKYINKKSSKMNLEP